MNMLYNGQLICILPHIYMCWLLELQSHLHIAISAVKYVAITCRDYLYYSFTNCAYILSVHLLSVICSHCQCYGFMIKILPPWYIIWWLYVSAISTPDMI